MKTPAKVFIWIGMIIQFFLVYPIILGVHALKKINTATTSSELQTLGIFTILFCSILGGVFMLCIKDDELNGAISSSGNNVIVYKKKHITIEEKQENSPYAFRAKKVIKVLLYTLSGVLLVSLFLSITATVKPTGFHYILLISVGVQILIYIALMVFYIYKKYTLKNVTNALLIAFGVISAVEIVMSGIANYRYAGTYQVYNGKRYWVAGESWSLWCLFALAIVCVAITVIVLYLSFKTRQEVKVISYTETSNVEIELAEAQRLLSNGIITNEEYQSVRKGILKKYYNVEI